MKASFLGDALNGASNSKCEKPVTVIKASPTVSTLLSLTSPITAGESVTDSATLSGASPTAHGTMTYQVFTGVTCSGKPIDASTASVINGIAQPSKAFSDFNTIGTYYFQATYGGDQNDKAATSVCSSESLTVNVATPTISTTLLPPIPATIVAGQSVTDSATLTGATSTAGGTVTYTLYRDTTCTTAIDTSTVTVTNGHVPNSKAFVINDASHTYGVEAIYNGDPNNNPSSASPCEEPINVNKATPSVSTQLSANPITATGTVTDTATLTASSGSNAAGTVTITMYTGGTCTGTVVASASGLTVTNNMATSGPFGPVAAGTYSFQAVYSGDSSNNGPVNSACEVLTVKQAVVSISTGLSSSSINTGTSVTDVATLTGFTATAAGSVTFTLYPGSSCSGTLLDHFTTPVTAGVENSAYVSPTFNAGGPYSIIAVYSGDANNVGATSACELLKVVAQPTISTALSQGTITDAQSVYDTSTLALATSNAGATVTYQLFPASAGGCFGLPSDTSQVTVINAIVPNSKPFSGLEFTPPGAYHFNAVYSGDSFNAAATSSCETLTVNAATPSISIQLSATTIVHGGSVTATATFLTGTFTSNAGGSVTYTLQSGSCGGLTIGSPVTVTVTNGVVPSAMFTIATAGSYTISVSYVGDANNNNAGPTCSGAITVT